MTYPLLICFSLSVAAGAGAAVGGKVELTEARKKGPPEGVVVWLEPVGGKAVAAPVRFVMDQRNKRFLPHVMAVPVGSAVDFPNHDPIFHNAFSNFAGQPFDTGLYSPGTSQKITFRREGVVRVFCNIHAQMSAVIVVVGSPYFSVSGASGKVRIENVPAGQYVMKVFHERATEKTLAALERRITVTNEPEQDLGTVKISETGYLEIGHKNKHGRDYPAVPAENGPYPGKK
jgi:plastocyanin